MNLVLLTANLKHLVFHANALIEMQRTSVATGLAKPVQLLLGTTPNCSQKIMIGLITCNNKLDHSMG